MPAKLVDIHHHFVSYLADRGTDTHTERVITISGRGTQVKRVAWERQR